MIQQSVRIARHSLAQGGLLVCVACVSALILDPTVLKPAFLGLAAAWAVCWISAAAWVWANPVSVRAFWWVYGGGMLLRLAGLGVLTARFWEASWQKQASGLVSYACGILMLLLLEFRNLVKVGAHEF